MGTSAVSHTCGYQCLALIECDANQAKGKLRILHISNTYLQSGFVCQQSRQVSGSHIQFDIFGRIPLTSAGWEHTQFTSLRRVHTHIGLH